jgi:gamma-glutamyl-gamma-aminobutyrate hydrolase PuuD
MAQPVGLVLEITPDKCYWPFAAWGEHTTDSDILWTPDAGRVRLVVFTGGQDVDPALYREKCGSKTGPLNQERDRYEMKCFTRARDLGIPLVGICRGSQFLCVMAGGKLCQDVANHNTGHTLRTHDGHVIDCNSVHHQMQLPPAGARILVTCEPRVSTHYWNGEDRDIEVPAEIEVVYYPDIRAVGMQYHPEYLHNEPEHASVRYAQQVVREFLVPPR